MKEAHISSIGCCAAKYIVLKEKNELKVKTRSLMVKAYFVMMNAMFNNRLDDLQCTSVAIYLRKIEKLFLFSCCCCFYSLQLIVFFFSFLLSPIWLLTSHKCIFSFFKPKTRMLCVVYLHFHVYVSTE